MISTQAEFNSVMANILAAKYLQLMGGRVELTQMEMTEMSRYGFQILMKYPEAPQSTPFVMVLITMEDAQKLLDQTRKQS